MHALRVENEEMKKKLVDGGPFAGPTNVVGRSYTSPSNLRPAEETKDKVLTHEMDGESCLNKSARTTVTLDSVRRHPFTNVVIEAPLSTVGRASTRTGMTVQPTQTSIWMPIPPI